MELRGSFFIYDHQYRQYSVHIQLKFSSNFCQYSAHFHPIFGLLFILIPYLYYNVALIYKTATQAILMLSRQISFCCTTMIIVIVTAHAATMTSQTAPLWRRVREAAQSRPAQAASLSRSWAARSHVQDALATQTRHNSLADLMRKSRKLTLINEKKTINAQINMKKDKKR